LQHKHAPGQLVNLLRVALEESVDASVRQVAAISFKNVVKRDWQAAGERRRGRRRAPARARLCKSRQPPHPGPARRLAPCAAGAEGKVSPIPEEDKAAVREALVEGVVRAPAHHPPIRSQLGECVRR
jgi:hypothetical protein